MLTPNRHRIGRQVMELEARSTASAVRLQEAVARPFRDRAPGELEELFDRLAGPEDVLLVDRLEVDLGDLVGVDWEKQLLDRLLDELGGALERARNSGREHATHATASDVRRVDDVAFAQLLFFLEYGRLPWWGGRPDDRWSALLGNSPSTRRLHDLEVTLRRSPFARRRLTTVAEPEFLRSVVEAWLKVPNVLRVVESLAPPRRSASVVRAVHSRLWSVLLDFALDHGPPTTAGASDLVRRLLAVAGRPAEGDTEDAGRGRTASEGATFATVAPASSALPQPWREWFEAASGAWGATPAPGTVERPIREDEPVGFMTRRRGRSEKPSRSRRDADGDRASPIVSSHRGPEPMELPIPRAPRPTSRTDEGEAIAVEGAGVVIVHPFLEELFRDRGLLADRDFLDEEARSRGVHLVARLTYGNAEFTEYDVLLPKLICGMPWPDPLVLVDLDDTDRRACDDLLRAVLGHWQALRSTSIDWLRQHFFLRPGSLQAVDHGMKLTVEQHAQDVLLGGLPWGIGLVRLPWMRELLHVRWAE